MKTLHGVHKYSLFGSNMAWNITKNGARINYTPWGTRADLRNESEPSKNAHRRGELR